MSRFLFVATQYDSHLSGGRANCRAHYEALRNIFGSGHVISNLYMDHTEKAEPDKTSVWCSRNYLDAFRNVLVDKTHRYSNEAEKIVIDSLMWGGGYSLVWFDDGYEHGGTICKLKELGVNVPVFVFHHTVEAETIAQNMRRNIHSISGIKNLIVYRNRLKNQRLAADYADVNVVLNDRDSSTLTRLYGDKSQLILPVCYIDTAKIAPVERKSDEFNLLFVGIGIHPYNVPGLKWFAVNVMPYLDPRAVLYIAGSYTERLREAEEFRHNSRIKILGRVESLDDVYNTADLSIVPVLGGEGMMTKVAEALMYGKNLVATTHALNGYKGLDACRCDTAEEFITRINGLIASGVERYNPAMRKIYEEKYSIKAMENMLRKCLAERHII